MRKISIIRLPLLLAGFFCFSIGSFAQKTVASGAPIVTLANMDANTSKEKQSVITVEKILASPKLKCNQPNCEIISFNVSMVYKNTDADSATEKTKYWAPMSCTGANLPDKIISLLKGLAGKEGKLFIENINVKYKNEQTHVKPVILKVVR